MLHNIPAELRAYNNFVLWRYEERGTTKPTKVPYSIHGYPASVNKPESWCDFDSALNAFNASGDYYAGIGFVLSDNDPFALIDLDDAYEAAKNYSAEQSEAILATQMKIYELFGSYAERSPSGKGLHILCKGSVVQGRKRAQVEVYSTQRFMTLTGDLFNGEPIRERQELLTDLWDDMSKGVKVYTDYGDHPQVKTDDEVGTMASLASNGHKFLDLYNGHWEPYYSSQSEADFALIDILAFYTQNRAQIVRMFRGSALGTRDKAFRDDYLDYMINKSFDHMLPPIDTEGLRIQLEAAILAKQAADAHALEASQQSSDNYCQASNPSDTGQIQGGQSTLPQGYIEYQAEQPKPKVQAKRRYAMPPGLLGEITQFIEAAAPRPVFEIALAGAIGLISGIAGRSYNVSGTGLNQYTMLVAGTGTGKEAITIGIDRLMTAVHSFCPQAKMFIGPGDISSAQALGKHFHRHSKCFVAMPGEIGIWLQGICSPFAGPHQVALKRAMLSLYSASGRGQIFKATITSQKENSTDETKAPAFSMLGESTPEEFYKVLDDSMVSSGLLPRFTIIEYLGKRVPKNPHAAKAYPSDSLIKGMATLCTNSLALNELDQVIDVGYTDDALALLDKWDVYCDGRINAVSLESGDVYKQLWNRGHLRALKLAAAVAVGIHPYKPVIDVDCAEWAIGLVNDDITNLLTRFDAGEVGSDSFEAQQIRAIIDKCRDYVLSAYSDVERYAVPPTLHGEKIIPYQYLQRRLQSLSCFKADKGGRPTDAIKRAIQTLIDRGDLRELPKGEIAKHGTTQRAFMIAIPRTFTL